MNLVGSMKSKRDFDFSSTIRPRAGLLTDFADYAEHQRSKKPIRAVGKFEKTMFSLTLLDDNRA